MGNLHDVGVKDPHKNGLRLGVLPYTPACSRATVQGVRHIDHVYRLIVPGVSQQQDLKIWGLRILEGPGLGYIGAAVRLQVDEQPALS